MRNCRPKRRPHILPSAHSLGRLSTREAFFDRAEPSLRGPAGYDPRGRSNPVIVAQRRWPPDCFASLAMTRPVDLIENRFQAAPRSCERSLTAIRFDA